MVSKIAVNTPERGAASRRHDVAFSTLPACLSYRLPNRRPLPQTHPSASSDWVRSPSPRPSSVSSSSVAFSTRPSSSTRSSSSTYCSASTCSPSSSQAITVLELQRNKKLGDGTQRIPVKPKRPSRVHSGVKVESKLSPSKFPKLCSCQNGSSGWGWWANHPHPPLHPLHQNRVSYQRRNH